MIALVGSGGSITSLMEEPGNQSLLKLWRQQVTRITVVNRFARKYRAKSLQCCIAPGLTAASPEQLISKVKDLLEKSSTSEGSKTRNLSTGALFSPNTPVQDAPKQKLKLGTSEKKNHGEGFFFKMGDVLKDHRALSTIQLVLTLLAFKILEEADLLDEAIGGLIIVTVIALDSRQEGTTATYNPVGRTDSLKGLLLLLYLSTFVESGVNALDDSEDGKRERPNERVDLPYNVQLAAWTIVAGIFIIAVIARRTNRRPLVSATAAAPLALPPPAAAPPALAAAVAAPPAVPPPPVPPPPVPAPAIPAPAIPPPAIPPPAIPPPAIPPPAIPPPAIPIGFINVNHVFEDNPAAARISDPDFYIRPPV